MIAKFLNFFQNTISTGNVANQIKASKDRIVNAFKKIAVEIMIETESRADAREREAIKKRNAMNEKLSKITDEEFENFEICLNDADNEIYLVSYRFQSCHLKMN